MQKEAENRVREMQSRIRLIGKNENPTTTSDICVQSANKPPLKKDFSFDIFGGESGDKFIILALLWILWNEKADPKLLLALLYLML